MALTLPESDEPMLCSLMNVQKHPAHPSGRHHDGGLDTGLREPWYQHIVLAAQVRLSYRLGDPVQNSVGTSRKWHSSQRRRGDMTDQL